MENNFATIRRARLHCLSSVIVLLALFSTVTIAADNKRQTKKPAPTLAVPFDIEAQSSLVTSTHDIREMIATLQRGKLKKDQFETTAAYEQRIASQPQLWAMKPDKLLAFQFATMKAFPWCIPKYSADTSELSIDCTLVGRKSFFLADENRFVDAYLVGIANAKDTGKYIGTNAFGVKKNITVRQGTLHGLAINNFDSFISGEQRVALPKVQLTVPNLDADTARKIIDDLGLLFVVQLIPPYLLHDSKSQSPTIDSPIDYSGEFDYLRVNLEQLWIVDLKSHKVLRKFSHWGIAIN